MEKEVSVHKNRPHAFYEHFQGSNFSKIVLRFDSQKIHPILKMSNQATYYSASCKIQLIQYVKKV